MAEALAHGVEVSAEELVKPMLAIVTIEILVMQIVVERSCGRRRKMRRRRRRKKKKKRRRRRRKEKKVPPLIHLKAFQ